MSGETLGTGRDFEGAIKPSNIEKDVYEQPLFAYRCTDIPHNLQLRQAVSRGDGQPDYLGYAPRGLASNANGWMLYKFTYTGNIMTLRQTAYGNWDNRTNETFA